MTIEIALDDIKPYATVPAGQEDQAQAWLDSLSALLSVRYDSIPAGLEPAVYDLAGQYITERFARASGQSPDPRVKSQSIAGASIEYFSPSSPGGLSADFLAALGALLGGGNTSSARTPAPDGIRYGNLMRPGWQNLDQPIESVI